MLVNDRKLKAATGSMHQFCQEVREVFPGDVDDRVVEAATAYLYLSLARDLFGQRFASKLQKRLGERLKYSTPAEVEGHMVRITRHAEAMEKAMAAQTHDKSPEEIVRNHVTAVIEAMLADAGFPTNDPATFKKAYPVFDAAIKSIRTHLLGIKEQNHFLMKNKPAA